VLRALGMKDYARVLIGRWRQVMLHCVSL